MGIGLGGISIVVALKASDIAMLGLKAEVGSASSGVAVGSGEGWGVWGRRVRGLGGVGG